MNIFFSSKINHHLTLFHIEIDICSFKDTLAENYDDNFYKVKATFDEVVRLLRNCYLECNVYL